MGVFLVGVILIYFKTVFDEAAFVRIRQQQNQRKPTVVDTDSEEFRRFVSTLKG